MRQTGFRYQNPPGSPKQSATIVDFIRFFWHQAQRKTSPIPAQWHSVNAADVAQSIQQHDHPQLTWMGHSTFLIQTDQINLLTDPFFSDRASPVSFAGPKRQVPPPITLQQLPKIDLILISHNHYDHMDVETLRYFVAEQPLVIVPPGDRALMRSLGFTRVITLPWGDHVQIKNMKLTALPAIHFSARGIFDRNRSLWDSYALEFPTFSVFFSCDTGYGPLYSQLGKSWAFDYALIPIGAYEPKSIMSAVHVTPEEALMIAKDLHAKHLIPMHWGTIAMAQEPLFEPIERLNQATSSSTTIDKLRIGESLRLDS